MPDTLTIINVPGRVIDFYMGGQAWIDYTKGRTPENARDLEPHEYALFTAVDAGRTVRPSKGGYYVRAMLSPEALNGLRYWAETLATAAGDEAAYDQDCRNDLRAATRVLAKLDQLKPS